MGWLGNASVIVVTSVVPCMLNVMMLMCLRDEDNFWESVLGKKNTAS